MRLQRRDLLLAGAAFAVGGCTATGAEPPAGEGGAPDARAAARDAYVFGLPLLEFARVRGAALAGGLRPNTFNHIARLADHTSRAVTTPNNDTVYSTAFLDLRNGPVTLTVPRSGARYQSLALMDAYTNNFLILGSSAPERPERLVLAGPTGPAPAGAVRSPTTWVWALGRTLVDGPGDLAAAGAAQRALTIEGPQGGESPFTPDVGRGDHAIGVLTALHRLIGETPPRPEDAPMLARIQPALADYTAALITPETNAALEAGVEDARAGLARAGGLVGAGAVQGWGYPQPTLGDFGTDYGYRAAVALGGLAALPVREAMYMRPFEDGRAVFPAGAARTLRFPPGGLPPLREPQGFWSLTMYEADGAGQFWLTDNPIRRYAIGDRTPGLKRDADGGLTLLIGGADPGPARRANWLPAPADKPWTVTLRTYLPAPALLEGRWRVPPLTPA